MSYLNNKLAIFFEIDQSTYLLIAFFCSWACYFVRARLLNAAMLMFLYPLFCLIAFAYYAGFMYFELFSHKKLADWIMYSVFAAAGGCTTGILLMSALRRVQESIIEQAHVHRMAKKDLERETERAHLEAAMTSTELAQQRTTPASGQVTASTQA